MTEEQMKAILVNERHFTEADLEKIMGLRQGYSYENLLTLTTPGQGFTRPSLMWLLNRTPFHSSMLLDMINDIGLIDNLTRYFDYPYNERGGYIIFAGTVVRLSDTV